MNRNFNDFVSSLTPEILAQIADDANLKAAQTQAEKSENALANQVGAISLTIALELLGLYHNWLSQES